MRATRPQPEPAEKPRIRPLDSKYDADEITAMIESGRKAIRHLEAHRAEFMALYPNEWVLVGPEGLITHSKTRAVVVRAARRQAAGAPTYIEWLKPRTLIL